MAYGLDVKISGGTAFGPFASTDRTLASSPFEAKAWDNFSLSEQTVIGGISWDSAYVEPFATGPNAKDPETDFVVEISTDNAGTPGNLIHTFSLDGGKAGISDGLVTSTLLVHTAESVGPAYHYSTQLPFTSLAANNYWISISAAQTFPSPSPVIDPTWQWHLGVNRVGADGFYTYDDTFDDPGDNDAGLVDSTPNPVNFVSKDLAFQLRGTVLEPWNGMIPPEETVMFLGFYNVTQADVDAGQIMNEATVTGKLPDGTQVSDSDQNKVEIHQKPEIHMSKLVTGKDADHPRGPIIGVGDPVEWTYEVTNVGNVTLSNVEATDDQGLVPVLDTRTDVGGDEWLSPGEQWLFVATGVAKEGQYSNLGTETGDSPSGSTVSDTDLSIHFGCSSNPGNVNGDGQVGFTDFLILAHYYGETNADPSIGDLNYDGEVSFADFLILANNFGTKVAASTGASEVTDLIFANGNSDDDWLL